MLWPKVEVVGMPLCNIDSSASAQDLQPIMAAHIESCYEHSKRMIIRFEQEHGSIQEL